MEPHPRQRIRERIMAALMAAATPAGHRVHAHRGEVLDEHLPPCYLVHAPEERAAPLNAGQPRAYRRELVVEVLAVATDNLAPENLLDDLARAAEEAILADPGLGGLAADTLYLGMKPQLDGQGAVIAGLARLLFEVHYLA